MSIKKFARSILLAVGFVTWAFGVLLFAATAWCAVAVGQLSDPEAPANCWIFALTRYWHRGGYLLVRPADDVRLFRRFTIPHVIWAAQLPRGMALEQFVPVKRSRAKFLPWQTIWYRGRVRTIERPHPAREQA